MKQCLWTCPVSHKWCLMCRKLDIFFLLFYKNSKSNNLLMWSPDCYQPAYPLQTLCFRHLLLTLFLPHSCFLCIGSTKSSLLSPRAPVPASPPCLPDKDCYRHSLVNLMTFKLSCVSWRQHVLWGKYIFSPTGLILAAWARRESNHTRGHRRSGGEKGAQEHIPRESSPVSFSTAKSKATLILKETQKEVNSTALLGQHRWVWIAQNTSRSQ